MQEETTGQIRRPRSKRVWWVNVRSIHHRILLNSAKVYMDTIYDIFEDKPPIDNVGFRRVVRGDLDKGTGLAGATGLEPQTITKITHELVSIGVVLYRYEETNDGRSKIYLAPTMLFYNPELIKRGEARWGKTRVCRDCGSARLKEKHVLSCCDCGSVQEQSTEYYSERRPLFDRSVHMSRHNTEHLD